MNFSLSITSVDYDPQAIEPTITFSVRLTAPQPIHPRFLSIICTAAASVQGSWLNIGSGIPNSIPSGQESYFSVPFRLGHFVVNAIEKSRTKDVTFNLALQGTIAFNSPALTIDNIDYSTTQRKVASSDWVDWLKFWGRDLTMVTMSAQTLSKILDIKEIQGRDPSETIDTLARQYLTLRDTLEQLRKESAVEFVYTELERRTIKDKMTSIINHLSPEDTLLITGYMGSPFLDKIIAAIANGTKIRVITRSLTGADKETRESSIRIFKNAPDGIRQNDTIHARLFALKGKEALISSADIKSDSIDTNYEAGVWTDNPLVMSELSNFFDRVWKDSKPFQAQSKP